MSDLKEETVRKNYVYRGKIISVRCDDARLPDGGACKREMVEHPGGAAVLCIKDGKVALVRQFRYAYGEELLEIPAGKLEAGEDPMKAAMRELGEETGLCAETLTPVLTFYPTPGYTNEKIYIFEAHGVKEGNAHPDADEFVRTEYLPLEEAYRMIAEGTLRDGKTVAALLIHKMKSE